MNPRVLTAALTLVVGAGLGGCSTTTPASGPPSPAATASQGAGIVPGVPPEAEPLLAEHGLGGLDAVAIVDRLDRLAGADRPADLMASVRPGSLQLSSGDEQYTLPIEGDRFYLSVAPYVDQTHECFHHSLTTCTGELGGEEVHVTIVDAADGRVLVDETTTTFANGFVGFWLPRGIDARLEVHHGDQQGSAEISTDEDSPTCLTTVQLA